MNRPEPVAVDDLHRRIGRNLVRFQQIEQSLKFCLPYMHPNGSALGAEAFRVYRNAVASKTLGPVVAEFADATDIPEGFFSQPLNSVVKARNELVHHLNRIPGIDLMSASGGVDLAQYLDKQFEAASDLYEFSRGLLAAVLTAIRDSNPERFPKFERDTEGRVEALLQTVKIVDS